MRFLLLAAISLSTVIGGCDAVTYAPSGENEVDLPLGGDPLRIDLQTAGDTLLLWGEVDIAYTTSGQRPPLDVGLYLNGQLRGRSQDGAIRLFTPEFSDGTYRLQLVAVGTSGTGSLADRLGREIVEAVDERVVVIENRPPEAPVVTTSVQNGLLTLSWSAPTVKRPVRYTIEGGSYAFTGSDIWQVEGQTEWADSSFVGGGASYFVTTIAGAGEQVQRAVTSINVSDDLPRITRAEPLSDGVVEVSWEPTPYTGALVRYEVRRALATSPNRPQTVFTSSEATSFVDDVGLAPFGTEARYTLIVESRAGRLGDVWPGDFSVTTLLEPGLPFTPQAYLRSADAWVGTGGSGEDQTLFRWTEAGRVQSGTEFIKGLVAASPSGDRLISVDGPLLREHDPATLSTTRSLNLVSVLGTGRIAAPAMLTENGRIGFSYGRALQFGTQTGLGGAVLDLDGPAFDGRFAPDGEFGFFEGLTDSGRYLVVGSSSVWSVYERTETGSFVEHAAVTGDAVVLLRGEDQIATVTGSTITVTSLDDMSALRSFSILDGVTELRYDPGTGLLYGHNAFDDQFEEDGTPISQSIVVMYDPTSGAEVARIDTSPQITVSDPVRYVILGGRLWWRGLTRDLVPSSTAR